MSFLSGERCSLCPFEPNAIVEIAEWINNPVTTYYMFYGQRPMTDEDVERMIRAQLESSSNILFLVMGENARMGFAGLYDIHPASRKAEFRILLGGARGKGIGTEVTEMLTFYGFDRLNLNRVYLGVTDENTAAVRAYQKAGYVEEGRLRQDIYRNGRYYDSIKMSMLRSEYEEKYKEAWTEKYASSPPPAPVKNG
jgi:RimJ/RimL family protein N-acetyltransferase